MSRRMSGLRHGSLTSTPAPLRLTHPVIGNMIYPASGAGRRGDEHVAAALVGRAADAFAAILVHWRAVRGLSKKQLAAEMGFDPSYVSHVEARRHRPTEDFARRADVALDAGGELVTLFGEFDKARQATHGPRPRVEPPAGSWRAGAAGRVVWRGTWR